MKKIFLVAAAMIGLAIAATAQPRAVGGRLGYGLQASYQHTIQGADFVEVTAGLFGVTSFNAAASYNIMIAQPDWTDRGEWGIYAGPGAALGYGADIRTGKYSFDIAAIGQAGVEYTFWFPLQLSVDLRPQFGLSFGDGVRFFGHGLLGFAPCISARYRF